MTKSPLRISTFCASAQASRSSLEMPSPSFERVDALPAGDVEQHAAADQLVLGVLDAELGDAVGVDGRGVMPVVHLVVIEDVAQRIPVRGRLDRHVERIVGVEQAALPAGQRVGAGGEHGVDGVPALAEQAALRAALPERHAEREHLAALDQLGRGDDVGRRDVVERADLVVLAPAAPVGQRLEGLVDRLLGDLDVAACSISSWSRHRSHPRSLALSARRSYRILPQVVLSLPAMAARSAMKIIDRSIIQVGCASGLDRHHVPSRLQPAVEGERIRARK